MGSFSSVFGVKMASHLLYRRKKVAFASRITYYLRRPKNVSIFENGLKIGGSRPKSAQKQCFLTFLGPWRPSADRFFDEKQGRGGSPALFLTLFSLKTGLETLRKRVFLHFGAFLEGFGAVLGRF